MSKHGRMNKFETPNALGHVIGSRQRQDQMIRVVSYKNENRKEQLGE